MHALECGLGARAAVRLPWHEIAALRKAPAGPGTEGLSPVIRLSDEQTALGMAALAHAFDPAADYRDWGMLGSARFFGRLRFATALERYTKLRVRGVSPLLVPHLSMHAIAATLSLGLVSHGPHFAVGGGPGHLAELLTLGLGVLRREKLPGLWLVATEVTPEPTTTEPPAETMAQAVALALIPEARTGDRVRLRRGAPSGRAANLTELVDHLLGPIPGPWRCALPGLGTLELDLHASDAALPRAA